MSEPPVAWGGARSGGAGGSLPREGAAAAQRERFGSWTAIFSGPSLLPIREGMEQKWVKMSQNFLPLWICLFLIGDLFGWCQPLAIFQNSFSQSLVIIIIFKCFCRGLRTRSFLVFCFSTNTFNFLPIDTWIYKFYVKKNDFFFVTEGKNYWERHFVRKDLTVEKEI